MARIPRPVVPHCPMHITDRGNNRANVFLDDVDRLVYYELLERNSRKHQCAVHAFVIMGNHHHTLLTPEHAHSPAKMMQCVGSSFAKYFNHRYRHTGTLWEGRYHSSLVQSSQYFFACSRYIELNPVRASMVKDPGEYEWSSYRRNAKGSFNALVTPHALYQDLATDDEGRQAEYRAMFVYALENEVLENIREGARRQQPTGDQLFSTEISRVLQRPVSKGEHGGDRRSRAFKNSEARCELREFWQSL